MPSTLALTTAPETVLSFEINPGTLDQLLASRSDSGPRLICFEGEVTLVSPGMPHELKARRLDLLIIAVGFELGLKCMGLASTTWKLPFGTKDTAYEADAAYYIQSFGRAKPGYRPDLAVEIVVSHPEGKALRAGAYLTIPEMWVLNVGRGRLTFYHLATRGKLKGTYRQAPRSRAFPVLASAEVMERLDDPETDDFSFLENCRVWARQVLVPRQAAADGAV